MYPKNRVDVSIIMPVYNAIKYIDDTLQSILNQTYKNFEVIIVDDGSFDGTIEICEKISRTDERIRIITQRNRGISSARNVGLENSKGEYICFCDHDDRMKKDFLAIMMSRIKKSEADVVFAKYAIININAEGNETVRYARIVNNEYCNNILESITGIRRSIQSVWNGIYRASIIRENNIKFDESMKYGGEDFLFNLLLLKFCKKIITIDEVLYFHYKRTQQSASCMVNENRIESILKINSIESGLIGSWIGGKIKKEVFIRCETGANLCLMLTVMNESESCQKGDKIDILKKSYDYIRVTRGFISDLYMLFKYPKRLFACILYRNRRFSELITISELMT